MNGRVYDPRLGRFLQADPFVQFAESTQSYNRYSYVLNNPLAYTDPTGYFSFKDAIKVVAVIAISVVTYGAASAWAANVAFFNIATAGAVTQASIVAASATSAIVGGVVGGAAAGFAAGVSMAAFSGASGSDALKAGFKGAFSGAVFGGIGGYFGNSWSLARVGANGLAGGVTTRLGGGNFKDGARFALAISFSSYIGYKMQQSALKNSQQHPQGRNTNGDSAGSYGSGVKLAGAREVLHPVTGVRQICVSTMGGCQGAPVALGDTRSSFFGLKYPPGSLPDRITEYVGGPHDWFRNATGSYITEVNGPYDIIGNGKYLEGFDQVIDTLKNYSLVVPAAPIGVSGLIDYSGVYGPLGDEF